MGSEGEPGVGAGSLVRPWATRVRLGLPPRAGPRGWAVSVGRAEESQRLGWGGGSGELPSRLRGQSSFLERFLGLSLRSGFIVESSTSAGTLAFRVRVFWARIIYLLVWASQGPFLMPRPRATVAGSINGS